MPPPHPNLSLHLAPSPSPNSSLDPDPTLTLTEWSARGGRPSGHRDHTGGLRQHMGLRFGARGRGGGRARGRRRRDGGGRCDGHQLHRRAAARAGVRTEHRRLCPCPCPCTHHTHTMPMHLHMPRACHAHAVMHVPRTRHTPLQASGCRQQCSRKPTRYAGSAALSTNLPGYCSSSTGRHATARLSPSSRRPSIITGRTRRQPLCRCKKQPASALLINSRTCYAAARVRLAQ